MGFREAPIHVHPELTWQLDITLPEEELLMKMRKTTRYLIRQGIKQEKLEILKSRNLKDVEVFNELYQKTVNRHHFSPFSLEYLKKEFLVFEPDNQILVFLAKYQGEILASAIILFWQGIGFYHHGASSLKYPKVPASYLLQWEAIREAKRRDCRLYNFWGIAESGLKNKNHPWWGLTLFKKGFFKMHDFTHVARLVELDKAVKDGHFPPRLAKDLGWGYGMPLFHFYGPMPYFLGEVFHLIGFICPSLRSRFFAGVAICLMLRPGFVTNRLLQNSTTSGFPFGSSQ